MNKRLLSLCLALTAVSVSALAESYGIFVGGVEVTSSNCNNVTGGDIKAYSTSVNGGQPKVTFVKGSGSTPSKLTLWNVKIDRTGNNNRAIHNRDCANLVIVFEGENYLRTTNATAIRIAQNTTIQGHRDSNRKMRTTVISTKENAVRVVSGKKLTIQYGFFNLTADNDDCFDSEDSPELVLESTVVTATSNSTSSDDSYALKNYKSLSISNSTVTLTGYKKAVSGLNHITLGEGQEDMLTPGIGIGYGSPANPHKELGHVYVVFQAYEWVTSKMAHYSAEDLPVLKFQMSPKISERFPDANFRSYITSNVDRNEDGYLDPWERLAQTEMSVSDKSISDLTGIELFEALNLLYCSRNSLTSLDLSKNTALTELSCFSNSLNSLDVTKNTALTKLQCDYNSLESLDVSQNTVLTELRCSYNGLTSLNVSANKALTKLDCSACGLTSLDVSQNTALKELLCYNNSLTSLDVSTNTALELLRCEYNTLTSLTVSKTNNTALKDVFCGGNQISGAAMTNLVNGLPTVTGDHWFNVCDDTQKTDNVITPAQVKTATDKGWMVLKFNGSWSSPYAGQGDVNCDNKINQDDRTLIVNIIMDQKPASVGEYAGDLNNDGKTDAADIVVMVNILKALGVK